MKAWVLEKQAPIETKPLSLQELPVPEVEEGEIRVKVHACGVCRTDVNILSIYREVGDILRLCC